MVTGAAAGAGAVVGAVVGAGAGAEVGAGAAAGWHAARIPPTLAILAIFRKSRLLMFFDMIFFSFAVRSESTRNDRYSKAFLF